MAKVDSDEANREPSRGAPLLVLAKIRGILDAFSLATPELTLAEIRRSTGFPATTVQRLVANLVAEGFLTRRGDRYRIGLNLAFWAAPATQGLDALEVIQPVLRRLRDLTGETTALFIREGDVRVCVAVAPTRHAIQREMHVGKIMPLHAGSAGRVLLAWDPDAAERVLNGPLEPVASNTVTDRDELRRLIDETRQRGYAVSHDERTEGASGISAPVFDSMGQVAWAINVLGPSLRVTTDAFAEWAEPVVSAAHEATRLLGGRIPS
jgi:DNA-binding IclR family transcriptional regulator